MNFKPLWSKTGLLIAIDFIRVEHGGRGNYYEIAPHHICMGNLKIPLNKLWKLRFLNEKNPTIDYIEFRTIRENIKVYYQINTQYVDYADYRIHFYYVSVRNVLRKEPINIFSFIKSKT
ncbi:MAG: hypothetical protein ACFFDB_00445 [Promethearchaeota archaeon]